MHPHLFINYNKCATLIQHTSNGENWVRGIWKLFIPCLKMFCIYKTVLKSEVYFKKK